MVAIFARISPFLLHGLKGVPSVIGPLTFPYMYTLSRKKFGSGPFARFDGVAHDAWPHVLPQLVIVLETHEEMHHARAGDCANGLISIRQVGGERFSGVGGSPSDFRPTTRNG